ncbi:MAG: hypothetical protein NT075_27605 [Chloroflexi bacterium]|nr:hypothetical protein [Chloroflexota bacterium]
MFTVALIGPDGAGKSTIGQQLEHRLPLPVKYVYMGINLESSNLVLPTTRLLLEIKRARGERPDWTGPPDPSRVKQLPKHPLKRLATEVKVGLRMTNLIAEEWFRQIVVWNYLRQGNIVLFDRHFFADYYARDIVSNSVDKPLARRFHSYMLAHYYPKPDLIIMLDAPAEVLFARKGEGTPALLESRRQEYLQLRQVVKHFATVDATQSQEEVVRQVTALIENFYQAQTNHNA